MKFSGAVLAGGSSRRMGRDKAFIEVAGTPMIIRVSDALTRAGAGEVLVVGGDGSRLAELGMRVVADRWPGEGPLGGIITALEASENSVVAVLACDLPDIDAADITELVESLGEHDAAMAKIAPHIEPLCGVWRTGCEPHLAAAFEGGERAVHVALGAIDAVLVDFTGRRSLRNVNTPTDLAGGDRRIL